MKREKREIIKTTLTVCKGLSCLANGAEELDKTWEKMSGGKGGKGVSLKYSHCLGLCDKGPSILLNGKPRTGLDESKAESIVDSL